MRPLTHRSSRPAALCAAMLLTLAGCASSGGTSWTFSPPAPTTPAASPSGSPGASPSASPGASPTGSPAASPSATTAAGNVIELVETDTLQIQQGGQKVTTIPVKQGQAYTFRISNPSTSLDHTFYIGTDAQLTADQRSEMTGVAEFRDGTKEFKFTFSGDTPLRFGCTVPGHYQFMQGDFQVQP